MSSNGNTLVLVTGASGYVAGHVIATLIKRGFKVRGTVTSLAKYAQAGQEHKKGSSKQVVVDPELLGRMHPGQLQFVEANLTDPDCWPAVVAGCTYVIHVASPAPSSNPKDENEIIKPAVEGTMNVLRAAHAAGVRRAVITSSTAAIYYGQHEKYKAGHTFTDEDWSDPEATRSSQAYVKSKTYAEKAAWKFAEENNMELVVCNPCFVLGPLQSNRIRTSMALIDRLINHKMPGLPDLNFSVVDVRDVALAHVRGIEVPEAAGHRFLLYGATRHIQQIAKTMKATFGPEGYSVPTRMLPYAFVWVVSFFDSSIAMLLPNLGVRKNCSSAKAQRILGIKFREPEQSIVDGGRDLVRRGLAHKPKPSKAPYVIGAVVLGVAAVAARYFGLF